MSGFELDQRLVDGFVDRALDPRDEAKLADQVARILPFHAVAPNPIVAALSRISKRLGGQEALLSWLDRQAGRPRLVARLFALIWLLDRYSDHPAVVDALRELRSRTPYPQGLAGYLVPDTNEETLADLSAAIESLLGEDRADEAVRLALATTRMLEQIAPWTAARDPAAAEFPDLLERVRLGIAEAQLNDGSAE